MIRISAKDVKKVRDAKNISLFEAKSQVEYWALMEKIRSLSHFFDYETGKHTVSLEDWNEVLDILEFLVHKMYSNERG